MRTGRVEWRGAEANIGDAVRKVEAAGGPKGKSWQSALAATRMPLATCTGGLRSFSDRTRMA
jgi:hypothetical protein